MRRQMVTTMYNNQKPHPIIVYNFISSWKFLKLDLFHIFLVNPVFVTSFVIKGNGYS